MLSDNFQYKLKSLDSQRLKHSISLLGLKRAEAQQVASRLRRTFPELKKQLLENAKQDGLTTAKSDRKAFTSAAYEKLVAKRVEIIYQASKLKVMWETSLMLYKARISINSYNRAVEFASTPKRRQHQENQPKR